VTFRERLARLNHLQQGRVFKIAASVAVVVLAIAAFLAYSVALNAPSSAAITLEDVEPLPEVAPAQNPGSTDPQPDGPPSATASVVDPSKQSKQETTLNATAKLVNEILAAKQDAAGVGATIVIATALALGVIWLGLGLTYLALGVLAAAVVWPLSLFPATRGPALIVGGVVLLSASFTVLMRLLGLLFSLPGATFAIAKNVLAEAVRMKLSLVFIVLLIFGLAALPAILNAEQPLRYRVQSFLQYATAGSFWIIAVLVLTFAVASVCFEQRDKVIWQTMTKPVRHWQYVLGKWVGISGLALALMAVCGSAIFIFTEYLRDQKANGESAAYVTQAAKGVSDDRLVLETQVLVARRTATAEPPEIDEEQFAKNVEARVDAEMEMIAQLDDESAEIRAQKVQEIKKKIADGLRSSVQSQYRSIEPGSREVYIFSGLKAVRNTNLPLYLRYKVDAGSNPPDSIYTITFQFPNDYPFTHSIGLCLFHTIRLLPGVIDEDGVVAVQVINADFRNQRPNAETITFPPGGLEISYSAGSYRMNFLRVMAVLWVKLAFLAMLAITAATFLSFPVACLVSFVTFLSAEGSRFILSSLEMYATEDREGKMLIIPTIIAKVAQAVGGTFQVYGDLNPTTRLVEGRLLPWSSVFVGTTVLALATVLLFLIAWNVFRKRELAMYSGQ